MSTITLPTGEIVLVDEADMEMLSAYRWTRAKTAHGVYARHRVWKGKDIYLHRLLLEFPADKFVDHINRDTLDNRRVNLRSTSPQESAYNRGRRGDTQRVKFKGVYITRQPRYLKKFIAQIAFEKKKIRIGSFMKPEEAARAYDQKCRELHGAFAVTNEDLGLYERGNL